MTTSSALPQPDETPDAGTDTPTDSVPFSNLEGYIAMPRVGGLALSPDGSRLVTSVATLNPDSTGYVSALWEIDPTGHRPAHRLTRSAKGEHAAAFTAAGDLLFTSPRPDPEQQPDADAPAALWLLPAAGGEARVLAARAGGVSAPCPATAAATVLVTGGVLASARDEDHDKTLRENRKKKKVSAILHTGYPVRHWDHDLGPSDPHLFVGNVTEVGGPHEDLPAGQADPRLSLRDITPDVGTALREQSGVLSADGATVVIPWTLPEPGASIRTVLMAIDTATGTRRELVNDGCSDFDSPKISPDGTQVAYLRSSRSTGEQAPQVTLGLVALAGGPGQPLALDWDLWANSITWLPDSTGILVTADADGRGPIFHISCGGTVTQVTADDATFSDVQISPDGTTAYAMKSSYLAPAAPVAIDLAAALAAGQPVESVALRGPVPDLDLPGTLTEVVATAEDGARIRGFLALPTGAGPDSPAPLLLWIHGGPLGSWNAWSWRWNPWLLVAQGYAVLLPDPALSTGYGQAFIQRGWGTWGAAPYTDLMAITDVAEARPDIDETRTAAMGGSFGGYMANWVAGHTDRFKAIVTHASLWALDQFGPTTDHSFYWEREMTPAMAEANSPHRFVGDIVTPMLVVHGDKDYRVPIGEGLRLWYELLAKSGLPADENGQTQHRFLYFPDENHWVLSPQNAIVWYEVVSAFLAEHVLGEHRELPTTLG